MTLPFRLNMISNFLAAHWRWRNLRGKALEQFQERRVQKMVRFAWSRSPFYRQHWQNCDLDDWRQLPILDKALMMENFSAFNTAGISREEAQAAALQAEHSRDFRPTIGGLTVGLSSGTSGHRGLFLISPQEQAAWAGTILARSLHHLPGSKLRVAFFLRANSNLYESVQSKWVDFRYFDIMLPIEGILAALNHFPPHILVGPPLLLTQLAQARQSGRLNINPERLISVAEVLEPQDKSLLENAFQAVVHQIYQCTEGLLAISCSAGALHIQEDLIAIQLEPLPAETPAVAQGQTHPERFVPIITDLWRTTQPIIRYRLNDILSIDPRPCRCGSEFRVIQAIEGRCDDICYFNTRQGGLRAFFPDTIRRMVLLADAAIHDYQAVQEYPGHLRFHLVLAEEASFTAVAQQVKGHAEQIIRQYDCLPPRLEIVAGLEHLQPGTKRRRVRCLAQSPHLLV